MGFQWTPPFELEGNKKFDFSLEMGIKIAGQAIFYQNYLSCHRGPSDRVRTCGLMVPNGSYCHFSRSSPLVFRPAVRCNAVVARCAEFLSGTVRKCVLSCLLSGCGCDCGSAFWVLLNVLRGCRQIDKAENWSNPHQQLVRNSINKTKDNKLKPLPRNESSPAHDYVWGCN